jgi:hypothetical protein
LQAKTFTKKMLTLLFCKQKPLLKKCLRFFFASKKKRRNFFLERKGLSNKDFLLAQAKFSFIKRKSVVLICG